MLEEARTETGLRSDEAASFASTVEREKQERTLALLGQDKEPENMESEATKFLKSIPAAFWVTTWLALNIFLTLINKAIFQFGGFTFPITLSALHMLVSTIFSNIVLHQLKWFPVIPWDTKLRKTIVYFSFIFSFNIILGNFSLRLASVSFVQVVRSIIPGVTMGLSIFMLARTYSLAVSLTMVPICVGMMLTVKGEVNFTFLGFFVTIAGCVLSALKVVVCSKFLSGTYSLHPIDLLDKTTPYAFLTMLPFIYMLEFENMAATFEQWGNLNVTFMLLLSSTTAFLLNVTNFFTNQTTSPLVLSVSGNVKQCLSIVISIIMFQDPINWINATGIVITILGTFAFNMIRYKERMASQKD